MIGGERLKEGCGQNDKIINGSFHWLGLYEPLLDLTGSSGEISLYDRFLDVDITTSVTNPTRKIYSTFTISI